MYDMVHILNYFDILQNMIYICKRKKFQFNKQWCVYMISIFIFNYYYL